jgi:hypothetical protein
VFRLNNVDAQMHQQIEMWPKDIFTHKFICTQKDDAQRHNMKSCEWIHLQIQLGKQKEKKLMKGCKMCEALNTS